jgi:glycosyltransferase involved in cell wall biosynthesis
LDKLLNATPLVSILTPVFNYGSFIEQTIRSVLNQTYENWEWIIIDDGSTDNTGDIIKGVKDSRIKYIFRKHAGIKDLVKSFNKALSLSNGDLIAMLDGDDYWPDYKLEVQTRNFGSADIVLSYGECFLVNVNDRKVQYRTLPSDPHIATNNPTGSSLKLFLLKRNCFFANSTVMINKKTLLSIGGFVEAKGLFQDFPTWTRLSIEGRFAANPCCLAYLRVHLSSASYNTAPEVRMIAGISFLRDFVRTNKQKLVELGCFYSMDILEEQWGKLNPYERYYSRAIVALSCNSFKEARAAFKKYLEKDASVKQKLIYCLVVLSSLLQIDLVNPLVRVKVQLEKMMSVHWRARFRS